MPEKPAYNSAVSRRVFGHSRKTTLRAGLYARISMHDQQTLSLQRRAMRDYAARRGWIIAIEVKEIGSGASVRELRQTLLDAARRRDIDVVVVWRLDRWGRSMADLVTTLQELRDLNVGFVSLTEALDLTTPSGRAMAGLLAVFAEFEREILQERVRAGLAHARENGTRLGRPPPASLNAKKVRQLFRAGISKSAIARSSRSGAPPCAAFLRKGLVMGDSSIQFHKIWVDQCDATEGIRERFGLQDALHYLIGEKLFSFVHAAEDDPDFAAELPAFVAEIRRIFSADEIRIFLDELERTKFLAPTEPEPDLDDIDDPDEEEPWLGSPVMAAEELLRFFRIRQLLQD